MSDLRKAAEMALEVLKQSLGYSNEAQARIGEAKQALRQALAQPEQEPVAWMDRDGDVLSASIVDGKGLRNIPLYTAPPKREWVGLTPDEISELSEQAKKFCNDMFNTPDYDYFAGALWRAIEAKLKEKNT